MITFLLTLAAFVVLVAAMSAGVMLAGKRLSGSCGGTGEGCRCSRRRRARCREEGPPPGGEERLISGDRLAR